jgi:alkylated DNA nucleotide flippase Atl1
LQGEVKMRRVLAVGFAVALLSVPVSMRAWGMDVHRFLTKRALDGLPPAVKPFFDERREFVSEHAADPDLWRVVGLKNDFGNEDPNHFLDIDALDDPPPFKNVPHDWTQFVAKYGKDRAIAAGRLPWRAEEIYKKLVVTFQDIGRPAGPPYAADNARYLSAVLAHYIEDAHVPFHATSNHDGQLTNQRGLHSRFESELVAQHMASLKLAPVTVHHVGNVREFVFDTLVESQALVAPVLRADREAAAGREFYDDRYFARFSAGALPIAEKRMSDAASAVASVIVAAWEEAGKPPLPLAASKSPARIRR